MSKAFKSWLYPVVVLFLLLTVVGCTGGCASVSDRETLVQISTIDALLNGVYDGVMDFGTLKTYGDFGIGTFDKLDGEMIECDGSFYQVKADGKAYMVADSMTTPFAVVTFFDADRREGLPAGMNYTGLQEYLDGILPTENIFYAVKIEGTFSYMKTRSVPAQQKPYPPLAEVTKNQPVFEMTDVAGTIVGFRSPPFVSGINVAGYHLHFLSKAKDAGGHILDFTVKDAAVYIDDTHQFEMLLPGADSDFYKIDLSEDKEAELEKVEK